MTRNSYIALTLIVGSIIWYVFYYILTYYKASDLVKIAVFSVYFLILVVLVIIFYRKCK